MTLRRGLLTAALLAVLLSPAGAVVRSVSVVEPGPTGAPAGLGGVKTSGPTGLSALAPVGLGLSSKLSPSAVPQVKDSALFGPVAAPAETLPTPAGETPAVVVKTETPAPAASPMPSASQEAAKTLGEAKEKKEGAPGLFRRMAKLFDGGRQAPPEPVLADYLASAPQLPLAPVDLLPSWAKLAPAPVRPQLRFELDSLGKWGGGAGTPRALTVSEGRADLPEQDVFEANGLVRKSLVLPAGSRQAVAVDSKLFYLDSEGRLVAQDRATGATKTYQAASGKVQRFLVDGSEEVYVVVDKRLERWRLKSLDSVQVSGDDFDASSIGPMVNKEEDEKGTGFSLYFPGGRVRWSQLGVEKYLGGLRLNQDGVKSEGVVPAGQGLYFRAQDGRTALWKGSNSSNEVDELGDIPYAAVSAARVPGRNALVAATAEGVVQWDLDNHRYRLFRVPGLAEAAAQGELRVQSADGRVYLSAGTRVMELSLPRLDQEVTSADLTRVWSEANPMSIKDGFLRIGDFSFPIGRKTPAPQPWRERLSIAVKRALGRPLPPQEILDLGISRKDWQAINLPTNKRLIYDTLKGFTLNQHILYIGETGGGKTWIAEKIAQLTNNELWMVSMNEYTRNKDLIARETFGEEGKNKTGLTMSTVLRWMTEGGVLLLDEMHKPLEGIAVLNNILQNGEYRLPDGRVIKYDKKKSWVIGTMNPVKPPYKGEPPSGELSSRFGMTLEVKYLPPEEESALLNIFHPKVPKDLLDKLVAIANDLRKIYPEVLPLPIAPRTLMHIVEHAQKYPNDSIADIFSKTYNPASIVEDPAISAAIAKVLKERDLAGYKGSAPSEPTASAPPAAAAQAAAVEEYLSHPPVLPLPAVPSGPRWIEPAAEPAVEGTLSFKAEKSETISEGHSEALIETSDSPAPMAVFGESEAQRAWNLPAGARGAVESDGLLYWIDARGRLAVYDPGDESVKAFRSNDEKVSRFMVAGKNRVFVLTGSGIRRWDLDLHWARTYPGLALDPGAIRAMTLGEESQISATNVIFHHAGGRLLSRFSGIASEPGRLESTVPGEGEIVPAGKSLYLRHEQGGTRIWRASAAVGRASELALLPYTVRSAAAVWGTALFAAAPEGLVVYDLAQKRYRLIPIPGLQEAQDAQVSLGAQTVTLSFDGKILEFSLKGLLREAAAEETSRSWSEANPMFVKGGALHIGDFSFPIAKKAARPLTLPARAKNAVLRALGLRGVPAAAGGLGISEKDWQALNLPTNKRLIYDTLKGFTLNQHILYIGETGGGKTWIAEKIAQLTNNELWMVSMNEYTRNKDLIARETFGEEGKNKTGLTMSTVLRWMTEGGVLLLDEMHKPLEGIAVLNNILQNGEYRLPDGRVIKYDKKKSWVIGTMNPVKPPYKGEPPSGELSSRFGMTLEVKYLPPEEESALLKIFHSQVSQPLLDKLVAIANELRQIYPEILPLPIAPRTLMHIVEHAQRYPGDSIADIFTNTYNPASIVEDPAISEAIAKALRKHDLSGSPEVFGADQAARRELKDIFARRGPEPAPAPAPSRDWDDDGGFDEHWGLMGGMGFGRRFPHLPPMPFTSPKNRSVPPVTPEMEGWANSLQNIARMLAQYPPLRLVPFYFLEKHGESEFSAERRWRAVTGMEEIHYLPEDMGPADKDVALGRTAHETWHFLYSRPELIFDEPDFLSNMAFQALWWAVEDPRVNNQGLARHPGARPWLDAAYEKDYAIRHLDFERRAWKEIPLHLQFNYGLIYEWWKGEPDPRITDSRVLDALQRAATAIRRATTADDPAKAFAIVRDQIWPIYKELIEEQVQDETQDQQQQQQKQKGQKGQKGRKGGQSQDSEDQDSEDQDSEDQDSDDQQQSGSSGSQGQQGRKKQKSGQSGEQDQQTDQQKDSEGQDGQMTPEQKKAAEERAKKEKQVREKLEQKSKEYRDKHAPKVTDSPEKMSQKDRERAKKEMDELRKKMEKARQEQGQKGQKGQQGQEGKAQEGKPQDGQPGQRGEGSGQSSSSKSSKADDAKQKAKQKERLNKADEERKELDSRDRANYQDYLKRVQRLVPVMRQQLLHSLKQKLRQRTIHNRDDGDLDPDALPRIPKGDRDVFMEEFSPNKVLYRISLLIDTSGSMSGEKKERAMEGAVMMMEALEKIPGVVFEIVKYDSDPKVLKPFGRKLTPDMKAGVLAAIRDGSGSTQAYEALKEAIERVRLGKGDKMIIMVNDGDPDNNFDRDAYRKMVAEAKDVEIHGIGLGPQAQLVLDLFPPGHGWWLKDAADFAKNLRNIVRKKLMGGRG